MIQRMIAGFAFSISLLIASIASTASAAVSSLDDFGVLNVGDSGVFSNAGIGAGSFEDFFEFEIQSASGVVSAAISQNIGSTFGIDPFSLAIFVDTDASSGMVELGDQQGTTVFGTPVGGVTIAELLIGLSPGLYALRVAGDVANSGTYTGSITAVPLPPAALLLGSAFVGLVAFGRMRRKSAKSAAV